MMACPYAGHVKVPFSKPNALMKGIVVSKYGGLEVLNLKSDTPVPAPACNQVLVKVFTVGVNPVDTYIREGKFPFKPEPPYIPGGDVAGIVESFGNGVNKFTRGQRVFVVMTTYSVTGGCADYMVVDQDCVFPLHDNLSFSQGACIGIPYFTAYKALFNKGNGKPGDTVLVHGASGGVGIATCQIARAHGMIVIGTASTEDGMEIVKKSGAHAVYNHAEINHHERIKEYVGESGVDIIVEMCANVNLRNDLDMVATNGRILIIGNGPNQEIAIHTEVTLFKQCCIQGVALPFQTDFAEIGAAICAGIEQGYIKPIIADEYPLAETHLAHKEIMEPSHGAKGKIIISLN